MTRLTWLTDTLQGGMGGMGGMGMMNPMMGYGGMMNPMMVSDVPLWWICPWKWD